MCAQAEVFKDFRGLNLWQIVVKNLVHRTPRLDDAIRRQPLFQQVFAGDAGIGQVDIADVIDDSPVDFLGNTLIEAAIACFHVKNWNLATLGGDGCQATVCVAQQQDCVRFDLGQSLIGAGDNEADGFSRGLTCRFQEVVGLPNLQIVEKNLIQFVIIILPGVNDCVVHHAVQGRHDARKPDDFRTRSQYRCNLHEIFPPRSRTNICDHCPPSYAAFAFGR